MRTIGDYGQIIAVTFSLKRAESDQLTSSLLKNGTLCNISLSDLTLEPVNVNVFFFILRFQPWLCEFTFELVLALNNERNAATARPLTLV